MSNESQEVHYHSSTKNIIYQGIDSKSCCKFKQIIAYIRLKKSYKQEWSNTILLYILVYSAKWILIPTYTGGVYKIHPKGNPDYELDIFSDPVQFKVCFVAVNCHIHLMSIFPSLKANIEGTTTFEFWDDPSGDKHKALAATNECGNKSTTMYLYPASGHIKSSSSDTNKYVWTKAVHH